MSCFAPSCRRTESTGLFERQSSDYAKNCKPRQAVKSPIRVQKLDLVEGERERATGIQA